MASLKDAAERQAFSLAIDATLKSLNKDREKGLLNIVNLAQKFMGSNFRSEAYEGAKKMIQNPDSKWMRCQDDSTESWISGSVCRNQEDS